MSKKMKITWAAVATASVVLAVAGAAGVALGCAHAAILFAPALIAPIALIATVKIVKKNFAKKINE